MSSEILLKAHEDRLTALETRVTLLEKSMSDFNHALSENTKLTQESREDLKDIVAILRGGQSAGKFVKWGIGIVTGSAAAYLLVKQFVLHAIGKA